MPAPSGCTVEHRKNGNLVIRHDGRPASTLRGLAAQRLSTKPAAADHEQAQQLPARATGNYRRGNERR